jgi:hypothetical protein
MGASVMWWELARTRWERQRYLRRVLREARRDVLFRPPTKWSASVAVFGYLVALAPLVLIVVSTSGPLPLVGGVLVTAQAVAYQRLTVMSPRLGRTWKRLLGAAGTVAAIGVAFSPVGDVVNEAWRDHPFFWRYGGIGLIAVLAGLSTLNRVIIIGAGLGRILSGRVFMWVGPAVGIISRILVGHGEFAVVLVAVAHPTDDLIPAAVTLAAVQTARLALRLGTRSTTKERLDDALIIVRLPAETRQRELAGWLYDTMLTRTGQDGLKLLRTLIGLSRMLAPDVTRDQDALTLPSRRAYNLAQSRAMLTMAEEAVSLIERIAMPRFAGVRRLELDQQIMLLRAAMIECEARLALADDEPEDAVAQLGDWARRLADANLPNLAANARTLQSCVALQSAIWLHEPIDVLADIVSDESLTGLVRRSALRLLAVNHAMPWNGQEPDLRAAREMWRDSRYFRVGRDDYRVVAGEARIETGPRRQLRVRRFVKGRLYERRLAILANDLMTRALVLGAQQ